MNTQPNQPEYPVCRCQKCGTLFSDTLDIYPGPAMCRECVEAEKAEHNNSERKGK